MNDTFMKEKPVFPLILSMALPMVISMLVNSLYNIVDSFFVAQISENAMTALSLVFPVQNFANAIAIGFGIGISSQIAICLGAGNRETASKAATHGLALSALHGVILTIGCILVMPGFLALFTSDADVIEPWNPLFYNCFSVCNHKYHQPCLRKDLPGCRQDEGYDDRAYGWLCFQYHP